MSQVSSEGRSRCEDKEDRQNRAVLERKHRHNEQTSVGRLPFELLVQVFLYCVHPCEDARITRRRCLTCNYWIFNTTQVCHRWREVALASPQLWNRVAVNPNDSLEYVDAMLSRSKDYPLDIRLWLWPHQPLMEICEIVFSNILRVRKLHLRSSWTKMSKQNIAVPQGTLSLRQLQVDGYTRVISKLEACDIPSLQDLSLNRCIVSWASSLLRPTLTRLVLWNIPELRMYPCLDVLHALGALVLLQKLGLADVLPEAFGDDHRQRASYSVNLPHLLEISVYDRLPSVGGFLHHLTLPTPAILKLSCSSSNYALRNVLAQISDKLTDVRSGTVASPMLSAALFSPGGFDIVFACYTTSDAIHLDGVVPFNWRSPTCPPPFEIHLSFDNNITGDSVLHDILRTLPLSTLTTLYLAPFDAQMDMDAWSTCCASLTNVRELRVGAWSQDTFPLALGLGANHAPSDAQALPGGPLFPQLQKLYLEGMELFSKGGQEGTDDEAAPVDKYLQALVTRKLAGIPVQELIVIRCYRVQQSDIDRLSKLVIVQWDGVSLDRGCEEDSDISGAEKDEDDDEDTEDDRDALRRLGYSA